jgi:MFS family permease
MRFPNIKNMKTSENGVFSTMKSLNQSRVPFSLRIGTSNTQLAFISSVPLFLGSLFQLFGTKLVDKIQNRNKLVTRFILLQTLMYLPLFLIPLFTQKFFLLFTFYALMIIFSNLSGPAWNATTNTESARLYNKRNPLILIPPFIAIILGGIIIYLFQNNIWTGFSILFGLALISGTISFIYYLNQEEPRHKDFWNDFTFIDFMKSLPKNHFGNFAIFRSTFALAVTIAAPFFAVTMLTNFQFTYLQYSIALITPIIAKILTSPFWSKFNTTHGPRNSLAIGAFLIALYPLFWIISITILPETLIFPTIIIAEFLSGYAWGGFEIATFSYMLESTSIRRRTQYFTYFNVLFGASIFFGGLIGILLVKVIPAQALIIVFLSSVALRFIMGYALIPRVKDLFHRERLSETHMLYKVIVQPTVKASLGLANKISAVEKSLRTEYSRRADPVKERYLEIYGSSPGAGQPWLVKYKR